MARIVKLPHPLGQFGAEVGRGLGGCFGFDSLDGLNGQLP
jgi:hypothetical protein